MWKYIVWAILVAVAFHNARPQTPIVVGKDGEYLGSLSANPYEPQSTSNPYGLYGSQFSPVSVSDQFGTFGSPYSNESANNEYLVSDVKVRAEVETAAEVEVEAEEK
jgi:hypothetical protein